MFTRACQRPRASRVGRVSDGQKDHVTNVRLRSVIKID